MQKTIQNRIQTELPRIDWKTIQTYQFNDLKESKDRDVSKLKNSIVNEGYCFPVFIWKRYVLDGTGRYQALRELEQEGYAIPDLPYIELEANNLQHAKKLALMASSRHGQISQKSFEAFTEDLKIEEIRLDICLPEIKIEVANLKLNAEPEEELEEGNDSTLDIECQIGDLWELNEHRILVGDCLDRGLVHQLMGQKRASLVFIDPPYNLKAIEFCGGGKTKHKDFAKAAGELKTEQFAEFLKDVFKNLISISRDGSIHYVCMDWRHLDEILSAGHACYTELKNLCVWAKDQPGQGTFYRSQHEFILVWKQGKSKHINNFELGQYGRTRSNVWNYPSAISLGNPERKGGGLGEFKNHPTPKPVNLVADCLLDCSNVGDMVVDTFLGSGTTLIAAEKTKRIYYGMEIEPAYVISTITRWVKQMEREDIPFIIKRNGDEIQIDKLRKT